MNDLSGLFNGVLLILMINLGVFSLLLLIQHLLLGSSLEFVFNPVLRLMFIAFSVFQWFYVVPIRDLYVRRHQPRLGQGILVGAMVTVLLNGSCWVWAITNL